LKKVQIKVAESFNSLESNILEENTENFQNALKNGKRGRNPLITVIEGNSKAELLFLFSIFLNEIWYVDSFYYAELICFLM